MKRTRWAIVLYLVAIQACAKNESVYSDVVSAKAPTFMEGDAQRDWFSNPLAGKPVDGLGANLEHATVDENKAVELDFVLFNHSDKEIVLPERVNSWGAYQWSFRVKDADGRSIALRNNQSSWFGNAFSVFSIAPGSKHLMRCRLDPSSSEFRDGAVEVFSLGLRGAPRAPNTWVFPLTVVGTFEGIEENKREATWSGAKPANWSGTLSTKPLVVRKAHNKSLSAGAEGGTG